MRDETKMMLAFLHSKCNRGGCDTCPFNTITETEFCPLEETEGVEKAFNEWLEKQEDKEGAGMIKLEQYLGAIKYHNSSNKNLRKREITKEQYDRAVNDHDTSGIFTDSEVMGYGVYKTEYIEEDGRYFVTYELGDTCD